MNRDLRAVTDFVIESMASPQAPRPAVVDAAQRLRKRPKSLRVARSARGEARDRRVKRTTESHATALLRRRAKRRDFACVIDRLVTSPLHMHHIIGRHDERLETVAMVCHRHHNGGPESIHAGNVDTLTTLLGYCQDLGMGDAAAAVLHRIEKIEEARR